MENLNPKPTDDAREKELAALSYMWIFSIPVLLAKRDSVFIQHHARRGFVLFLLSLVFWLFPFLRYGEFLVLALSILGFIQASIGNENTFPVLSEIADGTLRLKHLKHYWHHAKHGAIKVVKPDHITPAFRQELKDQERELTEQEKLLGQEKRMVEMEEKKLSALVNRVTEDEKRLDELSDEVHTLEKDVEGLKR